ncbi:MAG: polysaccharide pyruvyl transferase family protein [Psychroflexus sp.]
MKKIVYSGFYGFKNTGDDAFLEVGAWGSKEFVDTDNTVFLGHNLPKLINEGRQLNKPLFKGHNRIQGFKEIYNADYFISAGGSTFSNHKKNSLKELAEFTKKSFNKKLKTGAIGVSIGPFRSGVEEGNVVEYLKRMNFLAVRDRRSYEYVSSLNLPYQPVEAFDLAALLPLVYQEEPKIKKKGNHKIVGVSVCPFESISNIGNIENEYRRNESIIELLRNLDKSVEGIIFRFFIINGHSGIGDQKITEEVISKSGIKKFEIAPYQNSVLRAWNLVGECDFMIATRLHAGIFAAYNEVPFILNEYHQKCTDFLKDIGQERSLFVGDAEYDDFNIINRIINLLENKEDFVLENIDNTKKMALRNFSVL